MRPFQARSASRLTPKGALFCALDRCVLEENLTDQQILDWVQGYVDLLRTQGERTQQGSHT